MLCKEDEIMRKAYTRKGKRIPASCIHKVSPYAEKYSSFQNKVLSRMTQRLRGLSKKYRGNTKKCPKGEILRKSFVRYSKSGKRTLIKGECITKQGKPMRITGKAIGPLRKGELSQYGYVEINSLSKKERQTALAKAVKKFGSLSVWKKVNALYVLNKNTNPLLSEKYNIDRNWIRTTYGLKAL
jgi:hypothetical protein